MEDQEHFLESPITINNSGNAEDCQVVTLVSPIKKFIRKTYTLQQYFIQAQMQASELYSSSNKGQEKEDESNEEDLTLTPNQIMQMLLSSNVDIDKVLIEFERLAKLGAVTANDKKIGEIQWGKISDTDKEGLMTKYLAFFISTLALKSFVA